MTAEHAYSGRDFADLQDGDIIRAFTDPRSASSGWGAPDMTIANASRRQAAVMPTELFGPALPLLQAIAAGTATPLDYPAAGYLATCASLIGGKRRIRPYDTSNWAEPPILWIGIVGDPSSRKSPSLEAVVDPLRALERDGAEAHKADLREWREADAKAKAVRDEWQRGMAKAAKEGRADLPRMPDGAMEPDEPHRRRTLVGNHDTLSLPFQGKSYPPDLGNTPSYVFRSIGWVKRPPVGRLEDGPDLDHPRITQICVMGSAGELRRQSLLCPGPRQSARGRWLKCDPSRPTVFI